MAVKVWVQFKVSSTFSFKIGAIPLSEIIKSFEENLGGAFGRGLERFASIRIG